MTVELDVTSAEMDDERLQRFVFGLDRALSDAGGLRSRVAEAPAREGDRGAALIVGRLVLEVFKSAGGAALIEVLGAWLMQEPSVVIEATTPDGTVIKINARNVGTEEVQRLLGSLGRGAAPG